MLTHDKSWKRALGRIKKAQETASESLDLGFLGLKELPLELFTLKNLQRLNLWNNHLTALPKEISHLSNLTHLQISFNNLKLLPPQIAHLKKLKHLDIRSNSLKGLPKTIGGLKNLQFLHIWNNNITTLPIEIGDLKELVFLSLSRNELKSLPMEFGSLESLTQLSLSKNQFKSLPTTFLNLKNLKNLFFRANLLKTLPIEITQLENLSQLYLSSNQLELLPPEISKLTNLTQLCISNNHFESLPKEIFYLRNLSQLNVSNNQLSRLPQEICLLKDLSIGVKNEPIDAMNLYGNHRTLVHPPIEIILQGWQAIENYFQQLSQTTVDKLFEAKLIFIGEGGAGKTSLMRALRGEEFNPKESKTEGIEVRHVMLDRKETRFERNFCLNIWDFGGQEIYKDTHRFFLTRDTIYVLVTESRKNINYNDIYYWLNSLKFFAYNAPVLIVQNKCETHSVGLDMESYKKSFTNLVPWADILHTSCLPEEAHTITNLRNNIIKVLRDSELTPKVGDEIPATWVKIRNDLTKIQKNHGAKTLAYKKFVKICEDYGLKNYQSIKTLAGYFFRIGVFTYYAENLLLKRTIFLDNEWLTKGVYQIIDNAEVKAEHGLFTENDLATMYYGTDYAGREAEFANLMQEFKICYKVNERTYRCPLILPETTPETVKVAEWQQADSLHFAFEYPFMPRGILSTLIVNMHENIYQESLWKRGVVLEYKGAQALVYEGINQKYIHIYIRGQEKRNFLTIIARELEKIHRELNNLPHKGKLACRCSQCINNPDNPYFFKAEVIFRRWRKNILTVRCERSDEEISTAQLAGYMTHLPQEMDDTTNDFTQNVTILGGNVNMNSDSYNFHDNAKGNIGGQGNTYNEYQQNNGINTNISNSTIGGDITIKDNQVHNQQVDVDTEVLAKELNKLTTFLAQQVAENSNDANVSSAMMTVMQARQELSNGSQQTAIALLRKGGQAVAGFAKDVTANVVAGLILGVSR